MAGSRLVLGSRWEDAWVSDIGWNSLRSKYLFSCGSTMVSFDIERGDVVIENELREDYPSVKQM
jgi:hypothetical protein